MPNYENMDTLKVEKIAKQGYKDALYEMVWRIPLEYKKDPVKSCAWQDYWFEKAADAGHIEAKTRYSGSLINRVMNEGDRQKAMKYLQSLVDDFVDGKLSKDEQEDGIMAKLRLGFMLCEGYHTQRDAKKGVELIEAAYENTNGFVKYGSRLLYKLGELYATGLAQPNDEEEPSVTDLEQALMYLNSAIKCFNRETMDIKNLDLIKQLFDKMEERMNHKNNTGLFDITCFSVDEREQMKKYAKERRKKTMELSDEEQKRLEADKAALLQLREYLTDKGW